MAQITAYIGLGSNLGDRKDFIDKALKLLTEAGQIELVRVSELIETAPLGQAKQPDYLNAVAQVKTALDAEDFHRKLIEVENALGRVRNNKWESRTIDLDLLLFGNQVINTASLTVPHPQMHLRSFVLRGLCQLDTGLHHPVMKVSVQELARRLNGCDFLFDADRPQLVSIAGNIGAGKTTLAKKLAGLFDCQVLFEPYDTNPFMPEVYAGKKELALDSQLFFLTSRVKQLDPKNMSPGQIRLTDYVFDKELIYARALLDNQQLDIYQEIYRPLAIKVTMPVLVIYIKDSPQNCLERIRSRNRPYEQQIQLSFLQELDRDYDRLFYEWKRSPVIPISTAQSNYTDEVYIEHLANQIKCYITDKQQPVVTNFREGKFKVGRFYHGSCRND